MPNYSDMTKEELIKVINKLNKELKNYHEYGTLENLAFQSEVLSTINYNYHDEVYNDVLDWMEFSNEKFFPQFYKNFYELVDAILNELWNNDCITGNASGSYWFNSFNAANALAHNYELLEEALKDYGYDGKNLSFLSNYEMNDVTIRCYLLRDSVEKVIESLYQDKQYNHPEALSCFEHFCKTNTDTKDLFDFTKKYFGFYNNIDDAAEGLKISKVELTQCYKVYDFNEGIYLLRNK